MVSGTERRDARGEDPHVVEPSKPPKHVLQIELAICLHRKATFWQFCRFGEVSWIENSSRKVSGSQLQPEEEASGSSECPRID
jgi:hypothetical protein